MHCLYALKGKVSQQLRYKRKELRASQVVDNRKRKLLHHVLN